MKYTEYEIRVCFHFKEGRSVESFPVGEAIPAGVTSEALDTTYGLYGYREGVTVLDGKWIRSADHWALISEHATREKAVEQYRLVTGNDPCKRYVKLPPRDHGRDQTIALMTELLMTRSTMYSPKRDPEQSLYDRFCDELGGFLGVYDVAILCADVIDEVPDSIEWGETHDWTETCELLAIAVEETPKEIVKAIEANRTGHAKVKIRKLLEEVCNDHR